MNCPILIHLQALVAESIHIMREVVAECGSPIALYWIGKDSAVMPHIAMKAVYTGKPPFPLLHIDTTWKFRDMIAFRDRIAAELGLDLLVNINPEGPGGGNQSVHARLAYANRRDEDPYPKRRHLERYGFMRRSARPVATKRRAGRKNVFSPSALPVIPGTRSVSGLSSGGCTTRRRTGARASGFCRLKGNGTPSVKIPDLSVVDAIPDVWYLLRHFRCAPRANPA